MLLNTTVASMALLMSCAVTAQEQMSLEQAAMKSNNPVSDAWLLFVQNDYTLLDTPEGSQWQNATTIQPVMPVPVLDGEWNLVNRIVTGVVSSPLAENSDSPNFFDQRTTGNTDTVFFTLAAPNRDDGFIWGLGPTFNLPTATQDVLGSEKWAAGPAALAVRLGNSFGDPGTLESWNIGFLAQHWWDFAGDDDREDFNRSNIQYFVMQPDDFGPEWNLKLFIAPVAANTPNILVIWGDDIGVHSISVCNV